MWPFKLILFVGFAIFTLQIVAEIIKRRGVARWATRSTTGDETSDVAMESQRRSSRTRRADEESPDDVALWMFPALIVVILTGFPVALTMMALAVVFGLHSFGFEGLQYQFIQKIEEMATAQVLAAVPLFIFMGAMFEASGIASRLFDAIHMWTRRLPGGLAVGTVLMCVIFAATSGVVGATETVVGLLAIPAMLKYGYYKSLISGTICAGGSLGTIIPPSVLAVVIGPVANAVGRQHPARHVHPGLHAGGRLHHLHRHPVHHPPRGRSAHSARARRADARRRSWC